MKRYANMVCLFFLSKAATAQMLEEGEGVIEFALGFPNLQPLTYSSGGVFHGGFNNGNDNSFSIGQLILKGEFMASDRIGFVGSMSYGYFHNTDESSSSVYDPNTQTYVNQTYTYESTVHKFRFMAGINIHTVRTKRVDSYFGFHAGSKKVYSSFYTNDPYADKLNVAIFPFALRINYGVRYFFTEYLAANVELGLGGATISGGVTYKF